MNLTKTFVHLIPNKFLKRLPNLIEKYYFLVELLIIEYRYQYGITQVSPSVTVHLHSSNKQQLILTKFHIDSASSVGSQSA